jgi:hypothetical protein
MVASATPACFRRTRWHVMGVRALLAIAVVLLAGCASSLPKDYPRTASTAFAEHETTALGKEIAGLAAQHPGDSGYVIIRHGRQAFTVLPPSSRPRASSRSWRITCSERSYSPSPKWWKRIRPCASTK